MSASSAVHRSNDYGIGRANAFTGQIDWVEVDAGDDTHDHLINPGAHLPGGDDQTVRPAQGLPGQSRRDV